MEKVKAYAHRQHEEWSARREKENIYTLPDVLEKPQEEQQGMGDLEREVVGK